MSQQVTNSDTNVLPPSPPASAEKRDPAPPPSEAPQRDVHAPMRLDQIAPVNATSRMALVHDAPAQNDPQHVPAAAAAAAPAAPPPDPPPAVPSVATGSNAPAQPIAPAHPADALAPHSSTPVREMTFHVGEHAAQQVNVHVVDRGDGNVRISVRTANSDLSGRIQTDAPKLAESLHDNGFDSEVWTPAHDGGSHIHRASESQRDQNHDTGGSGSGAGQQQPQQERRQRNPNDSGDWQEEIFSFLPGLERKGDQQ
jgi:hypothetical protein